MLLRIILAAVAFSFLSVNFGFGEAASTAQLHSFYGQVKSIDLAARTITIKSDGKSFVFHVTNETKIHRRNGPIKLNRIRPDEGAAVVMRLGKGNIGIADTIRIDQNPGVTGYLSLIAAKTTRGDIITGLAVNDLIAYEPPGDSVNRGLSFAGRRQGFFLLTVQPDGAVTKVETLRSVGFTELDERAVKRLKKFRFHPNSVTEVRLPVNYVRAWP